MNIDKGLWLLPTRRRLGNLRRFFDAARTTGISTGGLILIGPDDRALKSEYDALWLPENWQIVECPADGQGDKVRFVWDRVKGSDWVGLIGDDNVPMTPDWDKLMIRDLAGWNLVSCNDTWQAPNRVANCWVWSGDLLRAVGYAFPPELNHLYIDDIWETLGRATGCWNVRMDVVVKHSHATLSHTEDDTHRAAYSDDNWAHDSRIWDDWNVRLKDDAIQAIESLKTKLGVVKRTVDVRNVKLMVATPSASDKFYTDYCMSLMSTFQVLAESQVPYKWIVERANSDLVAARAELLATFYYSDFTHLLLIDDDMGWEPQAVTRLFLAEKDFVAVVGRKKRDSIIYAFNPLGASGRIVRMPVDVQSGTCEVKEVGMAFVMLTRNCIEKMVEGYPELRYRLPNEPDRFSLFMPLVEDGVYKAEDYAFCARWRKLGGQVHICPDVRLKHIGGNQSYEGAVTDTWVGDPQLQAAE